MIIEFEHFIGTNWSWVAVAMLNSIWSGVVLTAVMWLVLRATPWLNATTRYIIWGAILLAVISLPCFPANAVILGTGEISGSAATVEHTSMRAGSGRTDETEQKTAGPSHLLQIPERLATLVFALWLLVATVLLVRLLVGYFRLQRLKMEAVPLSPEHQARVHKWLAICGIKRRVRVACVRKIQMPMAFGLLNVVILFPENLLTQLAGEEFDQILLHELAHISRRDDWTFFGQQLIQAILFFHPAILLIGRNLNLEREVACDDWVVTLTGRRRLYATCLTRLIELARHTRIRPLVPSVLVGRRHASIRVELLLDKKRNAKPRLCKVGAMVMLTMLCLMFSKFGRMTPAFAIARAGKADAYAFIPRGNSDEDVLVNASVGGPSSRGWVTAQGHDEDAHASEVRTVPPLSERDEREPEHRFELRVKELMEPGLRRIGREASLKMRPDANEMAGLAYDMTFERLRALEKRGDKVSEDQMRRIQVEVDEALSNRMDALERKVSAITEPETRQVELQARQQAAREMGATQK